MDAGRKKTIKSYHDKRHHKDATMHIEKNPVIVGLVHANWCGHCQHLMPEWNKMEDSISKNSKLNNKCKIIKIESEHVNEELPKYAEMTKNKNIPVEGYPTIFMIKTDRNVEMYGGERTAEALEKWVAGAVGANINNRNFYGGKKTKTKIKKHTRISKKHCNSCKKNIFKFW
jgi:thiol-disulfide isomerase/thioredoxin